MVGYSAQIVRRQTLSLKHKEFIEAARVIVQHIHAQHYTTAYRAEFARCSDGIYCLDGAGIILFECFLSFLELGTQER